MPDNTITVVGNITRDPELKFLNSGQAAVQSPLAEPPDPRVGRARVVL
jgi:single-stranded DNA-binding protein